MNDFYQWFYQPQFRLWRHDITPAGVGAFALSLLIGFSLSHFLKSEIIRRALVRFGIDKKFVAVVTATLSLLVFLASFVIGLQVGGVPIDWNARIPGLGLSLLVLFRLLLLLAFVFWGSSYLKRFFFTRFLSDSGLNRALQFSIAQMIGYVFLIGGVVISLQNAGIDLTALAFLAGAIGVGLGFGLQDIARNFVSGIILLFERPIEIGDRVEVGAVAGLVQEIRARSTTVLTNDNISIIVPNAKFIEDTVTNWSLGDPKVRFRIPVGVAYGSDTEKVRQLLLAVADQHPKALKDPAPNVFFVGFGDSSLNFELGVWTAEMTFRPLPFRSDLNFAIERALREGGIQIPFPQRDLHIRSSVIGTPRNEKG